MYYVLGESCEFTRFLTAFEKLSTFSNQIAGLWGVTWGEVIFLGRPKSQWQNFAEDVCSNTDKNESEYPFSFEVTCHLSFQIFAKQGVGVDGRVKTTFNYI